MLTFLCVLINFLKKLIRKLGYETIDQSNLYIPSRELEAKANLSESGKTSISIPIGKTAIKRKVTSLTIIIRSYTFENDEKNKENEDVSRRKRENIEAHDASLAKTSIRQKTL